MRKFVVTMHHGLTTYEAIVTAKTREEACKCAVRGIESQRPGVHILSSSAVLLDTAIRRRKAA